MEFKKIENEDEYKNLVEGFYFLADEEFKKAEKLKIDNQHEALAHAMPRLISICNVIGYLRGQDNVFVDVRPSGISFQKELYRVEDEFEKRLYALIDYLLASSSRELYVQSMEQYYMKVRKAKE